jgi:hypothetical protein
MCSVVMILLAHRPPPEMIVISVHPSSWIRKTIYFIKQVFMIIKNIFTRKTKYVLGQFSHHHQLHLVQMRTRSSSSSSSSQRGITQSHIDKIVKEHGYEEKFPGLAVLVSSSNTLTFY